MADVVESAVAEILALADDLGRSQRGTRLRGIAARLSQAGAGGGVVVKPLAWTGALAETPFCVYSVSELSTDGVEQWEWFRSEYPCSDYSDEKYPTEAAAKAAAQADYEARILAALAPSPSAEKVVAELRQELEALRAYQRGQADAVERMKERHRNTLAAAEARVTALEAEKAGYRTALQDIANQKTVNELCAEFGRDYETNWEGGYEGCIERARQALAQPSTQENDNG